MTIEQCAVEFRTAIQTLRSVRAQYLAVQESEGDSRRVQGLLLDLRGAYRGVRWAGAELARARRSAAAEIRADQVW